MQITISPPWQGRADISAVIAGFDTMGEVLYEGRNTVKLISGMVVKRFRRPKIVQAIAYALSSTKARRAYLNAIEMSRRGISTPESIAYAEESRHGLPGYTYYICTPDDGRPLVLSLGEDHFDKTTARAFAHFCAQLHSRGILHHDLNNTNVLTHEDGHFSLIDNNRMTFLPEGRQPSLHDCFLNLTRYTGNMELTEYVLRCYLDARGLAPSLLARAMAIKQTHDKAYARRKKITHCFKR